MPARIQTEDLARFRRDLRKLDKGIDRDLRDELKEAGTGVLEEARANAPIRTGALARSLKLSVVQRGVSIYSALPYAPVLHWGGHIEPRGVAIWFERTEFISKAVDRRADQIVEQVGDSIERAAKRAGWH